MIDDLKPYAEYKETGLPWLGRIPKHWDCLPHRAIFEEIKEQGHVDEQLLSVTIGKGVIRQEDLLSESSKKDSSNLDKSKYKLVETGDIAYNKMRAWQGAVGVSRYRGIVSPAYIVQRLRGQLRPEYFHYLFRTPAFAKEAERWSYGITSDQWSLRPQHFKMIYSCVPPLDEQELIVGFLRDFDRQVGRFIRNRRRLIEVLNEQKQAIINRAVTRGLDPNAARKPSGTDWLGDIPAYWEVKPVGYICTYISYGFTNPMPTVDDGPFMLTANDIGDGDIRYDTARHTTQAAFDQLLTKKSRPRDGDVLVTKDGTLGRVAVADGQCVCINQSVALLRPDTTQVLPSYLAIALQSPLYRERMVLDAGGTTIKHIYITRLSKMKLAYPSVTEQRQIISCIENETTALHRSIAAVDKEIELMREYRTRLIADVVMGKVDVRHLAPPPDGEDPEETVDELEPLDDASGELEHEALTEGAGHADD